MRILLATPYAPPAYAFGGPVRVIETVCAGLLDAGQEVTVVTTDALDHQRRVPAGTPGVPDGVRAVRFPNLHHGLAARAMGWTPRGYHAWLRRHAGEFDVVHLNDIYSVVAVAGARAAVRAGVPYVLQPHGSTPASQERGRAGVKRAFMALWGRRLLGEASALLAATARERADLVAAGAPADRIADVPPPLRLPHIEGRPPLPETPTVVFLGRLDPIKRVNLLLRAAARVGGVRVRIVGEGPEEPALRRLAAELGVDVEWAGFLDGEPKVRALQAAHVKVLLSRSEGLPVAALEAMACGTPVVLSPECNLPEADGAAGVVRDVAHAHAAIADVLADRERYAAGARQLAARFDAPAVMKRLQAVYADVARRAVTTSTSPPA